MNKVAPDPGYRVYEWLHDNKVCSVMSCNVSWVQVWRMSLPDKSASLNEVPNARQSLQRYEEIERVPAWVQRVRAKTPPLQRCIRRRQPTVVPLICECCVGHLRMRHILVQGLTMRCKYTGKFYTGEALRGHSQSTLDFAYARAVSHDL